VPEIVFTTNVKKHVVQNAVLRLSIACSVSEIFVIGQTSRSH